MNYSETIEALNDLIQINHDRIAGYERAIANINKGRFSPVAAGVMQVYIKDSQNHVAELSQYVQKMGGTPANSSTVSGKLHRAWMDIKTTFSFNDKETILESCIFGDQAAITTYEAALADEAHHWVSDLKSVLTNQLRNISLACKANEGYEKALQVPDH